MGKKNVWESSFIKLQSLKSATEAACLILSIDNIILLPRVIL